MGTGAAMIDIGTVVNGMTVDDYYDSEHHYDYPAFWLVCSRGHRTFATVQQIEQAQILCAKCATDNAARAARKKTDELIEAGRQYEPDFLKENL
jgi:hypothetical protein